MWVSILISISIIIVIHFGLEYLKPQKDVGVSFQTKKTAELIEELRQIRNNTCSNTKIELETSATDIETK
jgi:hypothetical protein